LPVARRRRDADEPVGRPVSATRTMSSAIGDSYF
jgi:hypothetical protein